MWLPLDYLRFSSLLALSSSSLPVKRREIELLALEIGLLGAQRSSMLVLHPLISRIGCTWCNTHPVGGIARQHGGRDSVHVLCQAEVFERPDDVAGEIELPPVKPMES